MWGKFFECSFTGSMMGAGESVFALWGYVIANTRDSRVEINPKYVSVVIGTTEEKIQKALDYLCAPDPLSRSKECEGRRLVKEQGFMYFVPTWQHYHELANEDERRAVFRDLKREQREKKAKLPAVESGNGAICAVELPPRTAAEITALEADFNRLYDAYPKKKRRNEALRVFATTDAPQHLPQIFAAIEWQRRTTEWTKDNGRYVPTLDQYLSDRAWTQSNPATVTATSTTTGTRKKPRSEMTVEEIKAENDAESAWARAHLGPHITTLKPRKSGSENPLT